MRYRGRGREWRAARPSQNADVYLRDTAIAKSRFRLHQAIPLRAGPVWL